MKETLKLLYMRCPILDAREDACQSRRRREKPPPTAILYANPALDHDVLSDNELYGSTAKFSERHATSIGGQSNSLDGRLAAKGQHPWVVHMAN